MSSTLLITSRLLAFTIFLQGIEYFLISRKKVFQKVWSFENLKNELKSRFLFSDLSFKVTTLIQIACALLGFIFPHVGFFVVIFITSLLITIRFRGSFNGGSDMMSFVVLTGVLISLLAKTPEVEKFGLIYIGIHGMYSYFKAGIAKIRQKDWREGKAVQGFTNVSLYPEIRNLKMSSKMSLVLGWLTILFELGIVSVLIFPKVIGLYFVLAIIFHLMVFASFGLNRFFWIWMCAWPSIFFTVTQIGRTT